MEGDIMRDIAALVFVGMFVVPIVYASIKVLKEGRVEHDGRTHASLRQPDSVGPYERECNRFR